MHPAREYKYLTLMDVTTLVLCKSLENTRTELSNIYHFTLSIMISNIARSLKKKKNWF